MFTATLYGLLHQFLSHINPEKIVMKIIDTKVNLNCCSKNVSMYTTVYN